MNFCILPKAQGNLGNIWFKVFKNGPSKICGRQPLKNLKGDGLLRHFMIFTNFSWSILEYFVPCYVFNKVDPQFDFFNY